MSSTHLLVVFAVVLIALKLPISMKFAVSWLNFTMDSYVFTLFFDGNGRIARVVTDQLAVSLGYVPIIAGFPRNNTDKKHVYHEAIHDCAHDSTCRVLSNWIKIQLQDKMSQIT